MFVVVVLENKIYILRDVTVCFGRTQWGDRGKEHNVSLCLA